MVVFMVELFGYNIPYFEYMAASIGVVIVIFILWFLLRSGSGRIGEEREEERETERLEEDEKKAESAQKDEKRQCVRMMKLVYQILDILRKGGMGEIYDKVLPLSASIQVMLRRLRDEKMSVERALETFKTLHTSLNEFVDGLPKDNEVISGLVNQLDYYQKNYYKDLIKEIMMNRDKKATLKKLWNEFIDEQSGTGTAEAA